MKTAYSTYSTKYWPIFKRLSPTRSERDYCEMASRIWLMACDRAPKGRAGMFWERDSVYVDNALEFLWRFRKVTHYFLAPGVADFCVSSVKEFSEDYCKRLPSCDPVDAPCARQEWAFLASLSFFHKGTEAKVQGGFAVHFPSKERQRSIMVIPDAWIPVPPAAVPDNPTGGGGALHYYFVASDGENVLMMQPSASISEFGSDEGLNWMAKLIFGLSLYMDAFPDAVVDADDSSVHRINHYDGGRRVVNRNEIVDEERRHGVSPHWRRGHFRLLTSAKFVRKQGQTVYIRGTFVKGKAFDVLDDAEGEKQ